MWRVLVLALAAALVFSASAQANVIYSEDFETGSDGWYNSASGLTPHPTNNYNATPGGAWSMWAYPGPSMVAHPIQGPATGWYITWKFYDAGATSNYLQMLLPTFTAPGVRQAINLGVYEGTGGSTDYYSCYIHSGSAYTWTPTSVARVTNTWHTMAMAENSAGVVSFYVDGVLAAQRSTTTLYAFSQINLGTQDSTSGPGSAYDDIVFGTGAVPEPSGMMLLASGLIGLVGLRKRVWHARR